MNDSNLETGVAKGFVLMIILGLLLAMITSPVHILQVNAEKCYSILFLYFGLGYAQMYSSYVAGCGEVKPLQFLQLIRRARASGGSASNSTRFFNIIATS